MKIVLISLPSPFEETPAMDIHLGLAYISAHLKSKGYKNIILVDFNLLKYDYTKNLYLKEIPLDADIYGITVTTPQFFWYRKIVEYIKEMNNDALVVSGGPHPNARPRECLERTKTDLVVQGEGEETFYEILKNIRDSRQSGFLSHIKGVSSFQSMGKRRIVRNLDSLHFPDRTLNNLFCYKRMLKGERALHVISARDCPYNCSFCSKEAIGRTIRFRSTSNFMAEIDLNIRKYRITRFVIYDDTFTVNNKRAIKIAIEMGKRNLIWRCFSRTDRVDREMLKTFKENGLSSITFGIETFSSKMLQVYNKRVTVEDNKRAIKLCRELGIPTRCSLIYGGPFESKETLEETIRGVKETQPNEWNISTFVPIPGSDIGDNPEKYCIKILPDQYYTKYHRVGESGMGEILVNISTKTSKEYEENRKWFVRKLEEVCPRKKIQDTIQTLPVLKKSK